MHLSVVVNRQWNNWGKKVEPRVVGAFFRHEANTRKKALAPPLGALAHRMEPLEESKWELGDPENKQGHSVKEKPYSVQNAVQNPCISLCKANEKPDRHCERLGRWSQRDKSFRRAESCQRRFEHSCHTTSPHDSNEGTRKHHNRKIHGHSHGRRSRVARAIDRVRNRVTVSEPGRDASVGKGIHIKIGPALDDEDLLQVIPVLFYKGPAASSTQSYIRLSLSLVTPDKCNLSPSPCKSCFQSFTFGKKRQRTL